MEKKLKTRIQHKIDTYAHWELAKNFIPLEGELIIYTTDENDDDKIGLKIGNGVKNVVDLDFLALPSTGEVVVPDGSFEPQVQTDYEQNDTSAIDYIKNRPFYIEDWEINWDGTPTNDSIDLTDILNTYAYKVEEFKPLDDILNSTFKHSTVNGYIYETVIKEENIQYFKDKDNNSTEAFLAIDEYDNILFAVTPEANDYWYDEKKFTAPTSGIWLGKTENTVNINLKGQSIKKLNSKFLSKDIQSNWEQIDKKAIDYIRNKPFNKETVSVEWDGDLNSTIETLQVDTDMWLCKISNEIVDLENIVNNSVIVSSPDGVFSQILKIEEQYVNTTMVPGITVFLLNGMPVIAYASEDVEYQGITISAGIWFIKIENAFYTKSFAFNKIHKYLDPEIIPNMYREEGTIIKWDGKPTDTIVYAGYFTEWDGNLLDKPYVEVTTPVDLPNGVPAGSTIYLQKINEKLDTLENYYLDVYHIPNDYTSSLQIDSNYIFEVYDNNDGHLIATHTGYAELFNVVSPGVFTLMGIEVEFIEEGLYAAAVPNLLYISAVYDENIEALGPMSWYKIAESLPATTLEGYQLNLDVEGTDTTIIFTNHGNGYNNEVPIEEIVTGSSLGYYFVWNIIKDNEELDLSFIGPNFKLPVKVSNAGLYAIDLSTLEAGVKIKSFVGPDYNIVKIDKKFLPDAIGAGSEPIFAGGLYRTSGIPSTNATTDFILMDMMHAYSNLKFENNQAYLKYSDAEYSIPSNLTSFYIYLDTFLNQQATVVNNPTISLATKIQDDGQFNVTYITTELEINVTGSIDLSQPAIIRCIFSDINGAWIGYPILESGKIDISTGVYKDDNRPITSDGVYDALGERQYLSYLNPDNYYNLESLNNYKDFIITGSGLYKVLENIDTDTVDAVIPDSNLPVQSKAVYEALNDGTVNAGRINGYSFNVSDTPPNEGEVDDYTITFVI